MKSFDQLNRKSVQCNVIDKSEDENVCNIFTKYIDESKKESFL